MYASFDSIPLIDRSSIRIMLINPSQSYPIDVAHGYQSYFPVGIASLGAVLEPTGAQIRLIDCLSYSNTRKVGNLMWYGMTTRQLRREIEEFSPHIVGINNAFSMFINDSELVADLVKSINPAIRVIVGGIEASVAPNNQQLLKRKLTIDLLVKGEGEITIRDLVNHFDAETGKFENLHEVLGIIYRDQEGNIMETANRPWIRDLDALPFPAYHLLDMDRMFENEYYARYRFRALDTRCIPVHTSRGCPYSCSFCSVHSQVGKPNRRHSPAYVVRHIKHLQSTYGITHIHFEDDNLTINPAHTIELFTALKSLGITFDTPNGIRADTITSEVAELFHEAGAKCITIAVESGVQHVLNNIIKKALDLEDVLVAADALNKADLPCVAFFIIGFPGETESDVRQTLRFAKRLATEFNTVNLLFVANPLPGTPLYQECVDNNYLVKPLTKETLFSGIVLNLEPLVETETFSKQKLLQWSQEELDTEELITLGPRSPMFVANNEIAKRRLIRSMGLNLDNESHINFMEKYVWEMDGVSAVS